MNRVGNKWTEEEEQRMVQAFQQGRALDDMARDHQRTPKALEMRRDHVLRRLSTKASVADLARLFGMDTGEVKEVLASAPPPLSSTTTAPSKEDAGAMKEVLHRLEKIETLLEKMYKRIKSREK